MQLLSYMARISVTSFLYYVSVSNSPSCTTRKMHLGVRISVSYAST